MATKRGRAAPPAHRDRTLLATVIGLGAGLLLLVAGYMWLIGAGGGALPRTTAIGGPFALVQGDGRPVTDRDFRGKYLLIYFGYTSCPDVCPTTLASVATALDRLGRTADRVQPLFVTVDPERDTPPVVLRYAASFSPRLIGLTGPSDEIQKVVDEYRITVARHGTGVVDHGAVIYLVGPDGRYLAPIRADAPGDAMARIIAGYVS